MILRKRSPLREYGVVGLSVTLALLTTLLLRRILPEHYPYLLFLAAVAISAGYGGVGPGVLATLLSATACAFVILPSHSFAIANPLQRVELLLFVLVALLISVLSDSLRVAYCQAEAARAEAEAGRRRIAFLAEASTLLDASLDYATTLTSVARLAVPEMADWCAIDILEPDQTVGHVAAAHRDPAKEELVRELQRRYPLGPGGQHPLLKALHTGQTEIAADISDRQLIAAARDPEHLQLLRALNFRSYMCVPLRARGRMLGAILFASAARFRYTPDDREFAEDLARRAALAVDNARLYREAREELAERRRTEEELALNQAHVEALNEQLQRAMTETHHRVKNNLQIIAAMIDMQVMEDSETVPAEELKRLGTHVRTLAAVHDILTQQAKQHGQADHVSAKTVLERLLPMLQQTAGNRRIEFSTQDARLSVRQGTSIALVANELVSNALKYGHSMVWVRFTVPDPALSVPQRVAVLEVCDDGPGFPEGFDPLPDSNTGIELVENLSRWDLGGKACYENRPEGGARVRIFIPLSI